MDEVEDFIINYEAALATQNWEQESPLIYDDCVATFPEGTYVGKDKLKPPFAKPSI
jgi:hypothetical protein